MLPKLKWFVLTFGRKPLFLAVQGGIMVLVAESPQFVLEKKKTNPQLFFQSSCPHQKVFAEFGKIQLSKHSDMTELLIVYSCLFHRILRRSLTIIFSQREGSSQLVSKKAHSLSNSQPWAIVVQFWRKKGRSLNLSVLILNPEEKCEEKSWRKMWYSLPSRLPQASAVRVWVGRFSTKQNPASRNTLLSLSSNDV